MIVMKLSVTLYLVNKQLLTCVIKYRDICAKKTNFLSIFPLFLLFLAFFSEMPLTCLVSSDCQVSFCYVYASVIIFTQKQNITM